MVENKRFKIVDSNIIEGGKFIKDNNLKYSFPTIKDASTLVMYEKVLNEQEETIQELLKYKYLVKALEEVSRGDIGEIIYDYAGEGYENEKSQLELGKICSENGLEGWR